ncbi:vasoactive intestinal polypeptide receptor-like [Tiliqua scincoides]|uniref:vasoactive intestinal polypeptide receptor-like n=1 Tax=Tiliqua scincoides TaxID=71010 RepID=UPI003462BE3B
MTALLSCSFNHKQKLQLLENLLRRFNIQTKGGHRASWQWADPTALSGHGLCFQARRPRSSGCLGGSGGRTAGHQAEGTAAPRPGRDLQAQHPPPEQGQLELEACVCLSSASPLGSAPRRQGRHCSPGQQESAGSAAPLLRERQAVWLADCKTKWDNLTCWPAANLGEVRVMPCPIFFIHFTGARGNVSRNCTSNGWSEMSPAQYMTACGYDPNNTLPGAENTFYRTVKTGYTIGYSLSLITLTAAMIVLCVFRKLHCTRNYIHMHLFMSFIMRAIAVFIKDILLFESDDPDHCSLGSVGCKAAMVFFQYCIMANFFWLLIEGLYLRTLLVVAFFSEKKYFRWYILIGWGVPSLFISAWTVTRIKYEDIGCWDLIESPYWWIIRAPILTSILVNVFFFICVIRILVQKLHTPDVGRNEASQYSRLAKSTLLLIPLFGIHYIIFSFFPEDLRKEVMDMRIVFELVVGSFQGFIVAVLYCFLNGEVQAELKRKWCRWHTERFLGSDMKYHHPSLGSNGTSTQISMLTKCSPKSQRGSSFQADLSLV